MVEGYRRDGGGMEKEGMRRVDLIGFLCPIPVHETRRVLTHCDDGEVIEVLCDDPETLHDIPALCDRMGVILEKVEEKDGEFRFLIANVTGEL
jgi:TusA-related sulfurtransferase